MIAEQLHQGVVLISHYFPCICKEEIMKQTTWKRLIVQCLLFLILFFSCVVLQT